MSDSHDKKTTSAHIGSQAAVSIVIPTFNNVAILRDSLQAVREISYPQAQLEVVVVDNGSSDRTSDILATRYRWAKQIRLEKNHGFAEACNRGAAAASGEYVAFLNDDALPDTQWLNALFAGLHAGGEGAVCAASRILSRDGREVEFSGASANLFGVGRPRSAWGWPDTAQTPLEGSPLLFASGGAMLINRRIFLDAGGFDPAFFAYFEDVDLGWRLWALGHKVVYAPGAVVYHIGGATGSRSSPHRRYTLWECNSLATILKNYEEGNMERILSAAVLLLYKRAILAADGAFTSSDYQLTAPKDTSITNTEQLPKISVAHIAAINRLNAHLPHFMQERRRIQAARLRSDREILPLLGRAFEPQFAGSDYAEAARRLAASLNLYAITNEAAPNRLLILVSSDEEDEGKALAAKLQQYGRVALATVGGQHLATSETREGFIHHRLQADDPDLSGLIQQADALIALPGAATLRSLHESDTPTAIIGKPSAAQLPPRALLVSGTDDPALIDFCLRPTSQSLTASQG